MGTTTKQRGILISLACIILVGIITFVVWSHLKSRGEENKQNSTALDTANVETPEKQYREIEEVPPTQDANDRSRGKKVDIKKSSRNLTQGDLMTDSDVNQQSKVASSYSRISEMPPAKRESLSQPLLKELFPNTELQILTWPTSKPPTLTVGAIVDGEELNLPEDFNKLIALDSDAPNVSSPEKMAEAFIRITDPTMAKHVNIKDAAYINEPDDELVYTLRLQTWTKFNGVVAEWKFAYTENGIGHVVRKIITNKRGDYILDRRSPCPLQGMVTSWRLRPN